jgi:UDP-N-acetyl-D-glucosamine dehydrogenase
MNAFSILQRRILEADHTVGIIGLGYVGLPLAAGFAGRGVRVLGFERDQTKIESINAGHSYIGDIASSVLDAAVRSGRLEATADAARMKSCDVLIICVPTPLDKFKKPDMSFIESACADIGRNMKAGILISLESTTYPTTTEEFIKPIIERESGMQEGRDFWLCYSPERIDPGNPTFKTANTPRVVGGLGPEARELALALYGRIIDELCPVSNPRTAEMVKILENTYRLVNISLINELALLCERMDIDIWEVVEAAKTKPYGFQAFYPGPGIGGHCIPLDPFYLEHVAKNFDFDLTMIETAGRIDTLMPHKMQVKIGYALNRRKKPLRGSKILFVGVAYKSDVADDRESPALKIIDEVLRKGAEVSYHDPLIAEIVTPKGARFSCSPLSGDFIRSMDCVVVTTAHAGVDHGRIADLADLVVDLRNAIKEKRPNVIRL